MSALIDWIESTSALMPDWTGWATLAFLVVLLGVAFGGSWLSQVLRARRLDRRWASRACPVCGERRMGPYDALACANPICPDGATYVPPAAELPAREG